MARVTVLRTFIVVPGSLEMPPSGRSRKGMRAAAGMHAPRGRPARTSREAGTYRAGLSSVTV